MQPQQQPQRSGSLQDLLMAAKGGNVTITSHTVGSRQSMAREAILNATVEATTKGAGTVPPEILAGLMAPRGEVQRLIPFNGEIQQEEIIVPAPANRKGGKGSKKGTPSPGPMKEITYILRMESGPEIPITERAFEVALTGESISVLTPISATRIKPAQDATFKLMAGGKIHNCYCPGIHVDFKEMGMGMSTYLVMSEQQ